MDLPRPAGFTGDVAFYYFALAVIVLGVAAIEIVRVTRLGRLVRAIGDSPAAMQSIGVSPTASRVMVFCLAAFVAGVAGQAGFGRKVGVKVRMHNKPSRRMCAAVGFVEIGQEPPFVQLEWTAPGGAT